MDPEIRRYIDIRFDELEKRVNDRLEVLTQRIRALINPGAQDGRCICSRPFGWKPGTVPLYQCDCGRRWETVQRRIDRDPEADLEWVWQLRGSEEKAAQGALDWWEAHLEKYR